MGWIWYLGESASFPLQNYDLTASKRSEAVEHWGYPKTLEDLTNIFLAHLNGKIPTTPFSPDVLDPESTTILPQLERLNKRGWWTVGSQPAVDGASSSDNVFGWGPKAGYVFQKSFVEFFCNMEDANAFEKKVKERGGGWVQYFMANNKVRLLNVLYGEY